MMDDVAYVLEGYARGKLRLQRCDACARLQFPPRAVCLACRSTTSTWTTCEPTGIIATFTVVHRAPTERFKARVPYAIALVDCAPGVRMMMNVSGDLDALAIGAPVEIGFIIAQGETTPRPVARITAAVQTD